MAGELTGTRRAYTRCGGCGHARQRHRGGGREGCVQAVFLDDPALVTPPAKVLAPCDCQHFTEPTESE